jgi:hypothetical protein
MDICPAFGVAWGTLFLGEPLAPGTFLGGALIVLSVCLVLDIRPPWPRLRPGARLTVEPLGSDA